MFVVGLTGGIGSGKSAASRHFEQLGITAVDADVISREVVAPGSEALQTIEQRHGKAILLDDGSLDRAALRQKIFSSPEEKAWLEGLLHPLIANETLRQLEAATSPYVLFVSPLLVESGQMALCQRLLVIDVPEDLQIERTILRDHNPRDQVERIMASQASREQRLAMADDVICNDRDLKYLEQEVDLLHQRYLSLATEHA